MMKNKEIEHCFISLEAKQQYAQIKNDITNALALKDRNYAMFSCKVLHCTTYYKDQRFEIY